MQKNTANCTNPWAKCCLAHCSHKTVPIVILIFGSFLLSSFAIHDEDCWSIGQFQHLRVDIENPFSFWVWRKTMPVDQYRSTLIFLPYSSCWVTDQLHYRVQLGMKEYYRIPTAGSGGRSSNQFFSLSLPWSCAVECSPGIVEGLWLEVFLWHTPWNIETRLSEPLYALYVYANSRSCT